MRLNESDELDYFDSLLKARRKTENVSNKIVKGKNSEADIVEGDGFVLLPTTSGSNRKSFSFSNCSHWPFNK